MNVPLNLSAWKNKLEDKFHDNSEMAELYEILSLAKKGIDSELKNLPGDDFGKRVLDPVVDHLKRNGVKTYTVVACNPDADSCWDCKDGSDFWLLGAHKMIQEKILRFSFGDERKVD